MIFIFALFYLSFPRSKKIRSDWNRWITPSLVHADDFNLLKKKTNAIKINIKNYI